MPEKTDRQPPPESSQSANDCRSDLFVWRKELQTLIDFAKAAAVSRRLRSVAAPPGYGKTCLLFQTEQHLSTNQELFVIRVTTEAFGVFDDLNKWLLNVVQKAQKVCPQINEINTDGEPEAIIGHLLKKLCEVCRPTRRIIIIIDALDELPNNMRRELENRFLVKFWRQDCVRMIVSFRDDFSLKSSSLRRGESRMTLGIFTEDQGREQLDKRAQVNLENLNISYSQLSQLVHPYKFTLPRLTTLLSQKVRENEGVGQTPVLTANDLRACWHALINRPIADTIGHADILERDLKTIVLHNEDSWTFETFAAICKYSQSEAFDHWQDLMALNVVAPHPLHKSRYMVIDGLRELLRAEIRLREKEKLL